VPKIISKFTFVEVIQTKVQTLFFPDTVYMYSKCATIIMPQKLK